LSASTTETGYRPPCLVHIPKNGGNTIVSHFLAFMPVDQVFPPPPQLALAGDDLAEAARRLDTLRFLHGHVDRGFHRGLPLDRVRMFTFVRHPIRRLVSHYLYFRHNPMQPLHRAATELRIDEFVRRFTGFSGNPQVRYLSVALGIGNLLEDGQTADMLDRGHEALSRMDFVGVTERMAESLEAMSVHFGIPNFPVARQNETTASRDEVEACDALLRRDEFLLRLGADFALRREAEFRLDETLIDQAVARMRVAVIEGLGGKRAMPWVLDRQGDAAVTFLDGWFPQGWVGPPAVGAEYWWTGETARLVVISAGRQPVGLSFDVVSTVGFDPATIAVMVGKRRLATKVETLPDVTRIACTIDAATLRRGGGAVIVTLKGARTRAFAQIDPTTSDYAARSFAARRITLMPPQD
jgi:hypothetical protein